VEAFHFPLIVQHSNVMQLKFHYYLLTLLSINIDDNRGKYNNYECTKAITQSVRYSPQSSNKLKLLNKY